MIGDGVDPTEDLLLDRQAAVHNLHVEVARLRSLLREVACCQPIMDDPRMHYVEVQIDKSLWAKVKEAGE